MPTDGHELERAFKVPSLRNVAERAPYMHAGQLATLADVLAHYNRAPAAPDGHTELKPLKLNTKELAQLEAFLRALSGGVKEKHEGRCGTMRLTCARSCCAALSILLSVFLPVAGGMAQDPLGRLQAKLPPKAAQPPSPVVEAEETVIVTATRTNTRLQDQPVRVEVIDREEIEEKALMTPGSVAMLLGETTGLRVQTTSPALGAANVRIQGLRGRYSQLVAEGCRSTARREIRSACSRCLRSISRRWKSSKARRPRCTARRRSAA